MGNKPHRPGGIVTKLRQVELLCGQIGSCVHALHQAPRIESFHNHWMFFGLVTNCEHRSIYGCYVKRSPVECIPYPRIKRTITSIAGEQSSILRAENDCNEPQPGHCGFSLRAHVAPKLLQ